MLDSQSNARSAAIWRTLTVFCAALAAFHLWRLFSVWTEWQAGTPDAYPGAQSKLLAAHVSGLALTLIIPLPGAIAVSHTWSRWRRVVLWGIWGTFMATTVVALLVGISQ